jgi:phosphatidylinositol glycan class T
MLTVKNTTMEEGVYRIYSQNLLLVLPTPDFSMPYNVITLTGTVIALFFGSTFNLMMRNFCVSDGVPTGLRGVVIRFIRGLRKRKMQ